MKKINLLLICIILTVSSFAQVAINTIGALPHASAILDIKSTNKGLLIPRVYLQSSVDNSTVPSPANSLLVWNNNTMLLRGEGFYYNSGTPASPNWQPMQDLLLPLTKSTSTNGAAFTIENYSQNTSSTAIKAVAGGSGNALEVLGKMKISGNGQSPAQGKVLTSDANGNATWEGGVAFSVKGVVATGSQVIGHYISTKVRYANVKYDLGGNYSGPNAANHSVFTAPVAGIYHFDAGVLWKAEYLDGYVSDFSIVSIKNGSKIIHAQHTANFPDMPFLTQKLSVDIQLQQGEQVFTEVHHNTGDYRELYTNEGDLYFNGRLEIKL